MDGANAIKSRRERAKDRLSDSAIKAAIKAAEANNKEKESNHPQPKSKKMIDGPGLFILIRPGVGWWRFRFSWLGKPQEISLGTYPYVSLKQARDRADEARRKLAEGSRPDGATQKQKALAEQNTFGQVAATWFELWQKGKVAHNVKTTLGRLKKHLLSRFADLPFSQVGERLPEVGAALQAAGQDKKAQTLDKVMTILSLISTYAEVNEIPGADEYRKHLRKLKFNFPLVDSGKHMPALTNPAELGALLRTIKETQAKGKISPVTGVALQLAALVFCRPGEIITAKWEDINFAEKVWRQPPKKTNAEKGRAVAPLAPQTLELLANLRAITGHTTYLFPNHKNTDKPMSNMAMNKALERMGYKGRHCAHGFRASAKTILTQNGFPRDWTEEQLGHGPKDKVAAAYFREENLGMRQGMMQWWADALDCMERGDPLPNSKPYR